MPFVVGKDCKMPDTEEELQRLLDKIANMTSLEEPAFPQVPNFAPGTSTRSRLHGLQKFISSFQYNHTGTNYFTIRKDRGLKRVSATSKEIIQRALPIKCLEAVFLATYLTMDMNELERIPISFKSSVDSHVFRHIVLAVRYKNKWGALGLSRKDSLMFKDLTFNSFSDLMLSFQRAYTSCWHTLHKIYVGFPFRHDPFSQEQLNWRVLKLRVDQGPWGRVAPVLDRYAKDAAHLFEGFTRTGSLPATFATDYAVSDSAVAVPPSALATPTSPSRKGKGCSGSGSGSPKRDRPKRKKSKKRTKCSGGGGSGGGGGDSAAAAASRGGVVGVAGSESMWGSLSLSPASLPMCAASAAGGSDEAVPACAGSSLRGDGREVLWAEVTLLHSAAAAVGIDAASGDGAAAAAGKGKAREKGTGKGKGKGKGRGKQRGAGDVGGTTDGGEAAGRGDLAVLPTAHDSSSGSSNASCEGVSRVAVLLTAPVTTRHRLYVPLSSLLAPPSAATASHGGDGKEGKRGATEGAAEPSTAATAAPAVAAATAVGATASDGAETVATAAAAAAAATVACGDSWAEVRHHMAALSLRTSQPLTLRVELLPSVHGTNNGSGSGNGSDGGVATCDVIAAYCCTGTSPVVSRAGGSGGTQGGSDATLAAADGTPSSAVRWTVVGAGECVDTTRCVLGSQQQSAVAAVVVTPFPGPQHCDDSASSGCAASPAAVSSGTADDIPSCRVVVGPCVGDVDEGETPPVPASAGSPSPAVLAT